MDAGFWLVLVPLGAVMWIGGLALVVKLSREIIDDLAKEINKRQGRA